MFGVVIRGIFMAGCTAPLFAMLCIEELLSTNWGCLSRLILIGFK
jgi:hypothetical protein